MNGIFVSPEALSPRSLNVVGQDGAMEMVGAFPAAIGAKVVVKVVVGTTIGTVIGTATSTVFQNPPWPF